MVAVSGVKNSGKTTLIVEMLPHLSPFGDAAAAAQVILDYVNQGGEYRA